MTVPMSASDAMTSRKFRPPANDRRPDLLPAVRQPSLKVFQQQIEVLQNREKVARLLRLFSSPRKRLGLTPDELLIFVAIGYLGTRVANGAIQMMPIGVIDISSLLGIPRETVRRKAIRLAGLDYILNTPKGILIKEITVWCQMLERAVA